MYGTFKLIFTSSLSLVNLEEILDLNAYSGQERQPSLIQDLDGGKMLLRLSPHRGYEMNPGGGWGGGWGGG
jgi:hypothetical protein